jgi:hypothetical protein
VPAQRAITARTGPDGQFRLEGFPTNTAADLTVRKPGKVYSPPARDYVSPETMQCRAGDTDVKLVVGPAAAIEGTVVEAEKERPVPGVELTLRSMRPGFFGAEAGNTVVSGYDGAFLIPDVAPGDYQVWISPGTNALPDWVADVVSVKVEEGKTTRDVKVVVARGGCLEVAVKGTEDGKPVVEANVGAYRREYQANAVTGTNGLALLRLPPGEYQVSVTREGVRGEMVKSEVESGATNRIEVELNPPPTIIGIVRDPSGAPVPGLPITLFGGYLGPREGETTSDRDGKFTIKWNPNLGPRDRGVFLIARDLARNLSASLDVDELTRDVELKLEPGLSAVGRVEDPGGKPITNTALQLHLWSGNMGTQFGEKALRTDENGRFEITALPHGRKFTFWANAKGYGSVNRNLEPDSETNRVELEPIVLKLADQTLGGQVVDDEDRPVARASVHISGEGQPNTSAVTDSQGRFVFEGVCEGPLRLYARFQRSNGNTQAQSGDTNVVIKLGVREMSYRAERPQRVSLRGKPLPDLTEAGLEAAAIPEGQPILVCLLDVEQRPCRRFLKTLTEQYEDLRRKGLTIIGLQVAATTDEAFKEWKEGSSVPFPVGRVAERAAKPKWSSGLDTLPRLILTDKNRKVVEEGFTLEDLEEKLKSATP